MNNSRVEIKDIYDFSLDIPNNWEKITNKNYSNVLFMLVNSNKKDVILVTSEGKSNNADDFELQFQKYMNKLRKDGTKVIRLQNTTFLFDTMIKTKVVFGKVNDISNIVFFYTCINNNIITFATMLSNNTNLTINSSIVNDESYKAITHVLNSIELLENKKEDFAFVKNSNNDVKKEDNTKYEIERKDNFTNKIIDSKDIIGIILKLKKKLDEMKVKYKHSDYKDLSSNMIIKINYKNGESQVIDDDKFIIDYSTLEFSHIKDLSIDLHLTYMKKELKYINQFDFIISPSDILFTRKSNIDDEEITFFYIDIIEYMSKLNEKNDIFL